MAEKKIGSGSEMVIPDYAYKAMASCLLPIIKRYYETEEGQQAFKEWQSKKQAEKEI